MLKSSNGRCKRIDLCVKRMKPLINRTHDCSYAALPLLFASR